MSIIISPYNARLGVSQFWSVDFLPIINSNYTLSMKRKHQNYIDLFEHFFSIFFRKFYKTRSFRRYSIVYSHFILRGIRFPTRMHSYQHLRLDLYLFDFNIVAFLSNNFNIAMGNIMDLASNMLSDFESQDEIFHSKFLNSFKKASLFRFDTSSFFRYNQQLLNLFSFLKKFTVVRLRASTILENYLRNIKVVFRLFLFFQRLLRIHNYFFCSLPLSCFVHVLFFEDTFNAKFIAFYIERKVASGLSVLGVISLIFKLVQLSNNISGLRIVCSGRIHRGLKGGLVTRHVGRFTFGTMVPTKQGFSMEYAEKLVPLYKGLCGFRIWISYSVPLKNQPESYFPISLHDYFPNN